MNWINLESVEQLNEVKVLSNDKRVLIMKYSPSSPVDHVVMTLLEREWNEGEMRTKTYLLDTDKNVDLTKQIDSELGLTDETPQVLILENAKPVFDGLHGKIIFSEIRKFAN